MKKKTLIALIMSIMVVFAFTACGGSTDSAPADTDSETTVEEQADTDVTEATKIVTYKSIYKKYKKKIEKKAPKLVDEYNEESAGMTDINEKAELSNEKIQDLAKIQTEGTEEMAELMYENGDEYDTYEKWANKLYDVYEDEAGKITDAYMNSAM